MTYTDEDWRKRLLELASELEALDEASTESRTAVELDQSRVGRLSRMDALQAQAMNNAVAARRRAKQAAIQAALQRLEEDEFGFCVTCGDAIAEKRLLSDPAAAICLHCSRP